jgi:hypothetical protein
MDMMEWKWIGNENEMEMKWNFTWTQNEMNLK